MSTLTTSWRCLLMAALCALWGKAPAPAFADENPATRPAANQAELQKIRAQVIEMYDRANDLDKDGKHDQADHLRQEIKATYAKLAARATAEAAATAANPEREHIVARLKEMQEKIGQLEQEGRHDQAEQLKKEARELYGKLHAIAQSTSGPTGPSPERRKLYEQYKALHEKIEAAKKAGNEEQVHQLMREMETLRGKLRSQEAPASHYSIGGGDREARLQHLRAAVEQLKAAGCEPEAQHVMEMVRHMEAEARAKSAESGVARFEGTISSPNHPSDAVNPAMVQELRSQIEQMRREIRQMREELNRARSGDRK